MKIQKRLQIEIEEKSKLEDALKKSEKLRNHLKQKLLEK